MLLYGDMNPARLGRQPELPLRRRNPRNGRSAPDFAGAARKKFTILNISNTDEREEVKATFQADPKNAATGILPTADADSEELDVEETPARVRHRGTYEERCETLGEQVKNAVEILVQRLDQIDADRKRKLLPPNPTVLYEACLTVMMRLVFILCAEQRRLLPLDEPVYDQNHAASTLREKLQEVADQHGEEILEHRFDAWARLLSLFRMVYGGFETESLRLPALGGALFDPDRFPFLEGRFSTFPDRQPTETGPFNGAEDSSCPAGRSLPIDNRTVLHLLTALEVFEQGTGVLLLSYRSLDVEQIGHVYEGLLEYTVKRLDTPPLGLEGTKAAKNPNITLVELESARLDGEETLFKLVRERTKKSIAVIRKSLDDPLENFLDTRINTVCAADKNLAERVKPFGNLLRLDAWDSPIIYGKDSFFVTFGSDRRETGAHYTPQSLTEEIVERKKRRPHFADS